MNNNLEQIEDNKLEQIKKARINYFKSLNRAMFYIDPQGPGKTLIKLQSDFLKVKTLPSQHLTNSISAYDGDYYKKLSYSRQIIPQRIPSKKYIYGN